MKRAIVGYILEYVEQHLNYLILRNYENLPEDEGHDLDLLIEENEYPIACRLICEIKERFGVCIFLHDDYYGLHSYGLIVDGTILHLDFFTHIQWNRISFIPTTDALARKQRYKESYWVLSDADLGYYCWVNYILAGGNVKEKYKQRALQWQEEHSAPYALDIRQGDLRKNRRLLIKYLCSSVPMLYVCKSTLANLCFKAYKLMRMDGRIYISNEPLNTPVEVCRYHCSCKQKNVEDNEPFGLFRCLCLLFFEYSVRISPMHWRALWWHNLIPRIYTPDCSSSLEELVKNIYRSREC